MYLVPCNSSSPSRARFKPQMAESTMRNVPATTSDVYEIPQELVDLRDMIRRLAQERIAPRAADIARAGTYPHDVRELLAEHDVLALPFAEEYGGTGTGTLMTNI